MLFAPRVLNTRVEYFANLQKTPLPHGDRESRQMHCMFLMCMVMLFVHVGEAVRALQRSSVVSPTTASKPTRFHDMSLRVRLVLLQLTHR